MFDASAGHSPKEPREGRTILLRLSLLLVAAALAGCTGDDGAPTALMDGSEPAAVPIELQSVEGPVLLTQVRLVPASEWSRESKSATCLDRGRGNDRPAASSVERVGVHSETVTFEAESRNAVFGCDNSPGPREGDRRWCGGAYGQLYGGRLRDPRLDIGGCRTEADEPIAFVWVEPGTSTRYVAVRQPHVTEVYEPAGGLPIRIATTSGFTDDPLGVTVVMTEHDETGKLLRSRHVDAVPAG